eukprot:4893079-Amphidinium_carterae.1
MMYGIFAYLIGNTKQVPDNGAACLCIAVIAWQSVDFNHLMTPELLAMQEVLSLDSSARQRGAKRHKYHCTVCWP